MEKKCNIIAENFPEALDILNKKFRVGEVLDKERKFLHFKGVNFVYRYRITFVVHRTLKCNNCGYPIKSKRIAYFFTYPTCQFCFKQLSRALLSQELSQRAKLQRMRV